MNTENFQKKLKPFLGYSLFLGMGLILFFFTAYTVVVMRTSKPAKIVMPDIRERYYLDVHNELMRIGLKVRLKFKRIPEKNDGMILYQSISPGKKITPGSIVYITVNNGVDRVAVPDVKGLLLNNAKARLDKVLSGETYVPLMLGGITYIPASDGKIPGTVVKQFPEAGKKITTREKVYLLVTEKKKTKEEEKDKQGMIENIQKFPFSIISHSLNSHNIPWKVVKILPTQDRRESGFIKSSKIDSKGVYLFEVYFFPYENRVKSGFEKIKYKVDKDGFYKIAIKNIDESDRQFKTIMKETPFQKDEDLNLVFYREGDVVVSIWDKNGKIEKSYEFESEL